MIDTIAKRYGVLPSNLLMNGDSLDLMVFDVALTWEKMQRDKANNNVDQSMYRQEDLQEMMNNVKNKQWSK